MAQDSHDRRKDDADHAIDYSGYSSANWVQLPSGIFVNKATHTVGKAGNPDNAKDKKRPWWKKVSVWLTAIIAVATVVQTLNIIRNNQSSGTQTDKLIRAANMNAHSTAHSAAAARSFAESAASINDGVSNAVDKLAKQAKETERARQSADRNSQAALRATIENFGAEQRPWIVTAAVPSGDIQWKDAAKWGFDINVRLMFKNLGKTPATDVYFSRVEALVADPTKGGVQDKELLERVCKEAVDAPEQPGAIVYPNILTDPVDKIAPVRGSQISREMRLQRHFIIVLVATCVRYKTIYQSTSKPHVYGAVYELRVHEPNERPGGETMLHIGQDALSKDLYFVPDSWTGPKID